MNENIIVDGSKNVIEYIGKAFEGAKPSLAAISGLVAYVMFPDKMHLISAVAVIVASVLDVITKSYAICKKEGGYLTAVKKQAFYSKELWKGAEVKLTSYLIIFILTGLAYRVVYLEQIGIVLSTYVYTVMFMREFQSNVENLIDAGADLNWLLAFSKSKNKEIMDKHGIKDGGNSNDL